MNSGKIAVIAISLLAVGVVALPQTVSMFAGQHYWYKLDVKTTAWESEVPCEKCHADVAEEMKSALGPHMGETGHGRLACTDCHRVKQVYQFAYVGGSYTEVTPGKYAHAATVPACMDCHKWVSASEFNDYEFGGAGHYDNLPSDSCKRCHYDPAGKFHEVPAAGGFGLTNGTGDTGSLAAHMAFINEARNSTLLKDENEACIACHTAVPVKINWTHARSIEFNIGPGNPVVTQNGPHNWTVTEWIYNGTAKATVWGNTTGNGTTTYGSIEWPGSVGSYT